MIPRPATFVLSVLIPEQSLRDAVIGDLIEMHGTVAASTGAAAANRLLWREIAVSAPHFVRATIAPRLFCGLLCIAGGFLCRTRAFLNRTVT